MIIRLAEGSLTTKFGTFLEVLYYDGQKEAIALVMGNVENAEDVLCRVHSQCISAHIFNSIECDCREQMEMAQFLIEQKGVGVIIWLDQEGRGNGHLALLSSAKMREEGFSQTEAYIRLGYKEDAREYKRVAEILYELKIMSVIMMTNNPDKVKYVEDIGIKVSGIRNLVLDPGDNEILKKTYMEKIERGHLIDLKLD